MQRLLASHVDGILLVSAHADDPVGTASPPSRDRRTRRPGRIGSWGFRRGLRAAGLRSDESLVGFGDFSGDSGVRAAGRRLDARPDIDAVFAASDLMAIGAVQELGRRRLRVPKTSRWSASTTP